MKLLNRRNFLRLFGRGAALAAAVPVVVALLPEKAAATGLAALEGETVRILSDQELDRMVNPPFVTGPMMTATEVRYRQLRWERGMARRLDVKMIKTVIPTKR